MTPSMWEGLELMLEEGGFIKVIVASGEKVSARKNYVCIEPVEVSTDSPQITTQAYTAKEAAEKFTFSVNKLNRPRALRNYTEEGKISHCPYCGTGEIYTDIESSFKDRECDSYSRCDVCDRGWYDTYVLASVTLDDGTTYPISRKKAVPA